MIIPCKQSSHIFGSLDIVAALNISSHSGLCYEQAKCWHAVITRSKQSTGFNVIKRDSAIFNWKLYCDSTYRNLSICKFNLLDRITIGKYQERGREGPIFASCGSPFGASDNKISRQQRYRLKEILAKKATMDVISQLQRQFVDYTTSLYREGYLDDQFTQLQKLQDESNPDFVAEVVSLFFEDSEKLLNNLATALQQQTVDYKQVDAHVHQFKGSSSSIGAQRVKNVCVVFRNFCEEKNLDGCLKCLQQLKHEYILVRNKLEALFGLEQQILAAGGSVPVMA